MQAAINIKIEVSKKNKKKKGDVCLGKDCLVDSVLKIVLQIDRSLRRSSKFSLILMWGEKRKKMKNIILSTHTYSKAPTHTAI